MLLTIRETVEINAPPQDVWQLFGDLTTWPMWNPTCQLAGWEDGEPWAAASRFRMTMRVGPIPLSARVAVVECRPAEEVTWAGGRFGVRSLHRWTFTPTAGGGTRVESHESFSGATLRVLRLGGLRCLVGHLSGAWLTGLKRAAETLPPD